MSDDITPCFWSGVSAEDCLRPEPEAYTTHLASLIQNSLLKTRDSVQSAAGQHLSIADFCTGTGCIALLLHVILQSSIPGLQVRGIDISPRAVALARENIAYNIAKGFMKAPSDTQSLAFDQGDLFSEEAIENLAQHQWDVITCNPPYISQHGFSHDTSRSVRNFEPKLAQVPARQEKYDGCVPEDVFYARLLQVGAELKPKSLLFEVGDLHQALRVVDMALEHPAFRASYIEVWRDWPDALSEEHEATSVITGGKEIPIRGSGHGRSVFIRRV